MRDGEGREMIFRNTVILMTANLGSEHVMQLLEEQPDATESEMQALLHPLLRDHFSPHCRRVSRRSFIARSAPRCVSL
jgi:type VI secretion system protein VasG